ncbi:hypothetical protein CA267_001915 [Alteromonas pelagimontana]|uniref:Uncharacterized protein n=1 Tax=Alteromonas pelagimontana TaxID=1858656 RepID=A0A6M4MAE8_9ALTE|nr:hypothetical protein [Alteromonas pelagimontana]QJR79640.1 hypothetical protein CA267_001915 [Alteromonas pelagimontana]
MNILNFKEMMSERDSEERLLKAIASDIENGVNIEPIPDSIFDTISLIEARAQAAREKRELLEG